MSLDSIELLVSTERLFQVSVSDEQAEQCATIGELAIIIDELIQERAADINLQEQLQNSIITAAEQISGHKLALLPNSNLATLFPDYPIEETFRKLSAATGLKMPRHKTAEPVLPEGTRILGANVNLSWPLRKWPAPELQNVVDWVASLNWQKWIDPPRAANLYEVQRVLCWHIDDHVGVKIEKIKLHHSFTNDLGID